MIYELAENNIKQNIYLVRGQRVILDYTLAEFYQLETSALKRAVRRNRSRFPEDFMFELTGLEVQTLICQTGIPKIVKNKFRGGNRFSTFAFTESGIGMLSSILKTNRAIQVNIAIMRAFVTLRQTASESFVSAEEVKTLNDSIRQLQGLLTRCLAQIQNTSIDDRISAQAKWNMHASIFGLDVRSIQEAVIKYYHLKAQDLKSVKRDAATSLARQVGMYLVREMTNMKFREIGFHFDKDHSTVLHAYQKVRARMEKDLRFRRDLELIRDLIREISH